MLRPLGMGQRRVSDREEEKRPSARGASCRGGQGPLRRSSVVGGPLGLGPVSARASPQPLPRAVDSTCLGTVVRLPWPLICEVFRTVPDLERAASLLAVVVTAVITEPLMKPQAAGR